MQKLMNIREVAAFIPCHPRTLRVTLADPRSAGRAPQPLPRPSDDHPYRFEKAALQTWLQRRAALREQLGKPHLRWCAPAAEGEPLGTKKGTPDLRASDRAGGHVEAETALRLRRHFAETMGDRMSGPEIDQLVIGTIQACETRYSLGA
jgi:hypothetical protein